MSATAIRAYPRIESDIPVQCAGAKHKSRARVLNLGGGGFFLKLVPGEELNSELSVRFRPGRNANSIRVHVAARHNLPGVGVGFEFTHIDPGDRERILRMVIQRCAQQDKARPPVVAQVQHAGGSFLAYSRIINPAGMFFETRETLPEGAEMLVRFRLGENERVLALKAEVVYEIKKSGLGIKWNNLSGRDRDRIEAYVAGRPAPNGWDLGQREEPGVFGVS